ncbi:hypothetical protein Cgig2_014922 [Carnegiea gigantea]|uniref:Reverse transcriptase zinc-binding domain-containing protein n=1 Tax=Carnegiea gigantea TaxID=171969 RepID=A0A9Q1JIC4_9CARY|nr:hypothetical protein Cgig2_014922 [Carnegiea gigantea]
MEAHTKDTPVENNRVQTVQTIEKQTSNTLEDFTQVSKRDAAKQPMHFASLATLELGEQNTTRHEIDMEVVHRGLVLTKEQQVLIQCRLPIKQRLSKYLPQLDNLCVLCSTEEEEEAHLFYTCNNAKIIWNEPRKSWQYTPAVQNSNQLMRGLEKSKGLGTQMQITSAIIAPTLYYIWSARNHTTFKKQQITAYQSVYLIKDQVRNRILFLSSCSKRFNRYIENILN